MKLYLKKVDNDQTVKRKPQPEDEETMTYKERPAVYGDINRDKGINSRKSVFDAQAVFKTSDY